ncbi:divergent polysaccharide deacetylase family protein [Geoalkalibacter halelectricus]|uniref:Divergent polysaccharide deacetylase family protein n=1 Tax=Geoalkalibacter halelectricus TaxID=2847045 RepID=A0ABY5ZPY4_9BACT|nr:divergent polysaccharide deacetylase family protein [Geoalkalibacter halelectricus]MDO3376942.1 divergent polysaccharide deacetylase family protein [Geoalkalibacter halelectricus]UWZ81166.1 divergent polysaccharide deacetylase family protein [Geoalkalibacter halelectricus]
MAKKKRAQKRRKSTKKATPSAREVKVWLAALFLLVFLVGSMALVKLLSDQLAPQPEAVAPQATAPALPRATVVPPPRALPVEEAPLAEPTTPESPAEATPVPQPVVPLPAGEARVAIIVDDLGQDLWSARALLALDLDLTFAVLPDLPYSTRVAQLAYQGGREVIVHVPMEPLDFPAKNPGVDALLTGLSDEEILRRLQGHLAQIPHAVGANNHMGSRFTQNSAGMRVVMAEMARREMFFVDSLTTNGSVVRHAATEFAVPFARRDIFLDNVQDVDKIRQELRRLIQFAQRNGSAIAICHPYRETLEALRLEEQSFARAGVRVVPVSQLLRRG